MAVTYQNKSETKVVPISPTCTISAPAGFSVGDLLIAVVAKNEAGVISIPAGWTALYASNISSVAVAVSYRIAESGDTSWDWTSDNRQWYGVILRYTGHDAANPIHASGASNGSSISPTAPSVGYTNLETNSMVLQVFGADDDDTPYTVPGALTERFNDVSAVGFQNCGAAGGDKSASGTGSTGTGVFTMNKAEQWAAVTVVIEASSGVGAVAPTSVIYGPLVGPLGGPI